MANAKILVIDDSRVIRSRVRQMLPPGNFEVLEAKDGLEGLNLIHEERPNLIMLDVLLPKLSGWEVFQQIQQHNDLRKIPLVVMSGRKEEVTEKIQEPFEQFEFISKPFDQKELIGAIKAAMAKVRSPRKESTSMASNSKVATLPKRADEIHLLNEKITNMQLEIDTLKKQLAQVWQIINKGVQ